METHFDMGIRYAQLNLESVSNQQFEITKGFLYGGVIPRIEIGRKDRPSNHVVRRHWIDNSKCLLAARTSAI